MKINYELPDDGNEVSFTDLLSALSEGFTLTNRGTGWWLAEPQKAYKANKSIQIPDSLVKDLETAGKIRIEIPYTSAKAFLTR